MFLWEVITREQPWADIPAVQVAFGIVNHGWRLKIPESSDPLLANLITRCFGHSPQDRPDFNQIFTILDNYYKQLTGVGTADSKEKKQNEGELVEVAEGEIEGKQDLLEQYGQISMASMKVGGGNGTVDIDDDDDDDDEEEKDEAGGSDDDSRSDSES